MKLCVAVETSASALGLSSRLCKNCKPAVLTLHSTRATQPPLPVAFARFPWASSSSKRIIVSSSRRVNPPSEHGARRLVQSICLLTVYFNIKRQPARYRASSFYSSRNHKRRRLQLKSEVSFRVAIDVDKQLDKMMTHFVNALLCEYVVAGVALLRLLMEQNILIDANINTFCYAYV